MWIKFFKKKNKKETHDSLAMFNQIDKMINMTCSLNELDEVSNLINDFSYKTDDVGLVIKLREEHEKAVLELCGNG